MIRAAQKLAQQGITLSALLASDGLTQKNVRPACPPDISWNGDYESFFYVSSF